jgi:hypothetical protein
MSSLDIYKNWRLKWNKKPKLWSNEWFELWQPLFLLAINFPFKKIRKYVRQKLEIDLDSKIKVNRLLRNSFRIKVGKKEYQETFYTKPIFTIALKKEWNWLWGLFHKWDMNFANKLFPKLNFGFDTLTKYPDAHPETNTVDGGMCRFSPGTGESWATIWGGAGTDVNDSSIQLSEITVLGGTVGFYCSTTTNLFVAIDRAITLFDTAALTVDATISAAVLSLYVNYKVTDSGSWALDFDIYTATPASNTSLATGDYSQIGSTSQTGSAIAYASVTENAYNAFAFNATGISNVSKTGISKFGVRNANYDVANSAPTWVSGAKTRIRCYSADNGSNQPKLVVTYTIPSIKTINGIAKASIKTINGVAIGSIKSINGLQ